MIGMRRVEALREAVRDVVSGAGRTATFAVLFLVLAGGVGLAAELSTIQGITAARQYVGSGSATYMMSTQKRIDGRACDALASLPNVAAAGAIREDRELFVSSTLPQTPISSFSISPGFRDLLTARGDSTRPGIALSEDVARTLGTDAGENLATAHGSTAVNSVFEYPDDGRDSMLAFSVLAVTPLGDQPFDACWVTIWPQDESAVAALGRTVLSEAGPSSDRPVLSQLNQTHGAAFTLPRAFGTDSAKLLAAVVGAVLGAAQVFRRRLVLASDRHIGVGRLPQVISQTAQCAVWVSIGAIGALSAALVPLPPHESDRGPLLTASALILVAGAGSALASCAFATCLIRESSLFRYFKNR
ncbi:hypothetical protein DOE76_13335 [Leifsonia sp. ku-ls]|nr:hypothetical protein DOE76_13335 [Leifsonia sp. ku-ls]